jgi:flagellar basal-body rod protein FlgG
MNSGMYAAVSGNNVMMQKMEVIANNLANMNTVGFKKDRMVFDTMLNSAKNPTQSAGTLTDAPVLSDGVVDTDYSAGPLKQTSNPLDLALDGSGYFVVKTPQGMAYTRQGDFHIDSSGKVVTTDGYEVQAGGGPVTIKGGKVDINSKGEVSVDGQQVATLSLVDFPKPYQLQKIGSAMFVPANPQVTGQPTTGTNVKQGALEESNVQAIVEMANLIETSRSYESCVKTIQAYDAMANKAANELGKV